MARVRQTAAVLKSFKMSSRGHSRQYEVLIFVPGPLNTAQRLRWQCALDVHPLWNPALAQSSSTHMTADLNDPARMCCGQSRDSQSGFL